MLPQMFGKDLFTDLADWYCEPPGWDGKMGEMGQNYELNLKIFY